MVGQSQGDEQAALAGMAQVGNPRIPMDRDAIASFLNLSGQPQGGMVVPRHQAPLSDPGIFPTAARTPVMLERGGARYSIRVGIPSLTMPEAGATQANGRIIRDRGTGASFWGA